MKTILIVDDDINSSLTYKKWLEDEGFNLTIINDPNLESRNLNLNTMTLFSLVLKCL
ncbi:MAG: hypothetical protein R3321_08260 [Nitrososphaeraceae archaeon]|nr:hypothetical protein [Nitrososphaeraceae archaeon]